MWDEPNRTIAIPERFLLHSSPLLEKEPHERARQRNFQLVPSPEDGGHHTGRLAGVCSTASAARRQWSLAKEGGQTLHNKRDPRARTPTKSRPQAGKLAATAWPGDPNAPIRYLGLTLEIRLGTVED